MLISDDNKFAYVVTFNEIQVHSRNMVNGQLTHIQTVDTVDSVSIIVGGNTLYSVGAISLSPDGMYLYAATTFFVYTLARDTVTGLLSPYQTIMRDVFIGDHNNFVTTSDGRHVYLAGGNNIFMFERDAQTDTLSIIDTLNNVNFSPGIGSDISLLMGDDDRLLFITGGSSVSVYERDDTTGLLTFKSVITGSNNVNPGLTFSKESERSHDSRFIYTLTNALGSGALVVLSRDTVTDSLTVIQTEQNTIRSQYMSMTDDKQWICISNGPGSVGDGDMIFYQVDSLTGNVTEVGAFSDKQRYYGKKCFDRTGGFMYSAPRFADSIYIYGQEEEDAIGLVEYFLDDHVTIYPNPIVSQFNVKSNQPLTNASFEMLNSQGQVVLTAENLSGNLFTVPCRDLPGGIYFARLYQSGQTIAIEKVVVRKHR